MRMPGVGFPDKIVTKLRYHEFRVITSTTGGVSNVGFLWNSVYDPDATYLGHQPLYRDTLAAVYDQYAVISAKAKIKFINTSTTAPFLVGCVTDDDTSSSTTVDTLCEQTHGQHTILPPLSGSLSSHTFNPTWDCMKILSIDPYASETYKTVVGSNPTEQSVLFVWAATADASTANIYFDIEIEMDILWTELTTPTQS
jgi:hypothetical protein